MSRNRIVRARTRNVAETSPAADDPRLVSRRFTISFDDVWYATLLVASSMPGWTVGRADDRDGRIEIRAETRLFGFHDDVTVRVWLDTNAITRVDVRSASRFGFADFGANARRVADFYSALDDQLLRWGKDQALPVRSG